MNAQKYLNARQIAYKDLKEKKVGRLAISAEFSLDGERGVVIRPKRGSVSDRYLSLLTGDGVQYVIADTGTDVSFYGSDAEPDNLVPWRALPATEQRHFPSEDVWDALTKLLRKLALKQTIEDVAAHLLLCRMRDEEQGYLDRWNAAVNSGKEQCSDILSAFDSKLISCSSDAETETLLTICAIMAGFRITPADDNELAILLEWFGRSGVGRHGFYGVTRSLAFIFEAFRGRADHLEVATTVIGAQLLGLKGVPESSFAVARGSDEVYALLETLFPTAQRIAEEYLSYQPQNAPDRIMLVPPFGQATIDAKRLKVMSPFFTDSTIRAKVFHEYLYILHALEHVAENGIVGAIVSEGLLSNSAHAVFRNWLLENSQLLGVISLPSEYCFEGTGVQCSLLFLKKRKDLPQDYAITMMELRSQDLTDPAGREEAAKLIEQMLREEDEV